MHCCLQDYAVTLTDALAELLAHPAVLYSIDQHATGYSPGDLQSLLEQLPYGLLHHIMGTPVAQQCWHYLAQHLFPFCAQMFVSVARDFMRKSERALTACPQLELFVHMLGDCHMLACLHWFCTVAVALDHECRSARIDVHQYYPGHERGLSQMLCGPDWHHRQHNGPLACIMMNCLQEHLCRA